MSAKINSNTKPKKTAWELIEEIPNTPEQKKIDREISAIERKYEKTRIKRPDEKKKNYNKKVNLEIRSSKIDLGINAGKIWNALDVNGPLDNSSIVKNTNLSMNEFFAGIGWLARENKISKDMNYYKLGNTNLTNEIGKNAGKIWKLIDSKSEVDIITISKYTKMKIEEIYLAIGWLSRENKIKFSYKNSKILYELT